MKWLADQGFELCDHTLWHAKLSKYPDAVVQEQIARNAMGIDSAVPGYKIRTMALPYGLWPKNRPLAWQGSWTDPKTKQTHSYKFDAVLEVAGRSGAQSVRSAVQPEEHQPHRSDRRRHPPSAEQAREGRDAVRGEVGAVDTDAFTAWRDIEGDDHVVAPLVHPCSEFAEGVTSSSRA